jgi:enoyl-CoA hydratase
MKFGALEWIIEENIAYLTIQRPEVLNALNQNLLSNFEEWLDRVEQELDQSTHTYRCIVIKGAGEKAFVAGADIHEFKDKSRSQGQEMSQRGQKVFKRIEELPLPVVAYIDGYALGGGAELALACHFRVGTKNTVIGFPEVKLGLIPGYGGTVRLSRIIGYSKALEWMTMAPYISAEEAYRRGALNVILEHSEDDSSSDKEGASELNSHKELKKWLQPLIKMAPLAIKNVILSTRSNTGIRANDRDSLQRESVLFGELFETQDANEGINAFIEKRSPKFQGK